MIITNLTAQDYWFGPMHLPAGSGQTLNLDDTSDTSLYLLNDEVADAVNTLYLSASVAVTSNALPFPRATGTPGLLHGDGSPEGKVYAPQGSLYLRRDTVQASTSLYSKQTGITQNTGWVSVISAAGDIIPSAAPSRDGCLPCDGTSYLRASYPVLFAAIGTAYGSVDGTHFNVPDLRGRVPLGAGTGSASGASAWTLGEQPTSGAGGEEAHTLASGEIPAHNHGVNDPGHNHGASTGATQPFGSNQTLFAGSGARIVSHGMPATVGATIVPIDTNATNTFGAGNDNHSHSVSVNNNGTGISTQNTGGGGAHNNVQPVSVVNWFIVHG